MTASPTLGDVKALDKLARQLKSQSVKLQFWPLTGPLRTTGFPDASYRNNEDGSPQRGMAVFLSESRERSTKDGMSNVSLIDYESQRTKKDSALHYCDWAILLYEVCWFMPVSPWIMDGLIWRSCKNPHQNWYEEPCYNNENNAFTWTKGDDSHDLHVAQGILFRKYSWSCSHSNQKMFGRLLDEGFGEGRQFDHSSQDRKIVRCWHSPWF